MRIESAVIENCEPPAAVKDDYDGPDRCLWCEDGNEPIQCIYAPHIWYHNGSVPEGVEIICELTGLRDSNCYRKTKR